ncbi:TIGR02680 family protein [Sorangium sp. So ce1036]|uniref:TIGR02680 family protein n=1 Tax=Sorangium sp. So ce1036 TaxID=3133328 RepID=UPI003F0F7F48
MTFPSPVTRRWQPLRSGLLNLYRYDSEEFLFEHGRLLLRGNNGSGKSRVLALQLPFLLDGEVSPHRLEPDADPAKRIEWNLLLGRHEERRGYTWLELGRRDDDGAEHYLTLGCGLHAVEGRGLTGKWLFVTSKRVGRDLSLESAGAAIGRERLEAELGDRGEVFTSAAAYRAAVDRRLFQLGERYGALLDLLIQLRQPQLSRKLDEAQLSRALSSALPPVPPAVVADLAESFRSLEADRAALEGFAAASAAASSFLDEYRRYLKVAARRRAAGVRGAHAAYEAVLRELRAAEVALDEARAAGEQAAAREQEAELAARGAAREVETLSRRPEMDQARALDEARRAAAAAAAEAQEAALEHRRAEEQAARRALDREEAEAGARAERDALSEATAAAAEAAAVVGLPPPALPEGWEADLSRALPGARARFDAGVAERRRGAAHVRKLEAELAAARAARERAEAALEGAAARLERARERAGEALAQREAAAEALVAAWSAWARALVELPIGGAAVEEVAEALAAWAEHGDGASPAAQAAQRALADAQGWLAAARAEADRAVAEAEAARRALEDERAELERGAHRAPQAPPWRAQGAREGRPGAPLWQLCDFDPGLDADGRAGLEAALEAAGLLDAWVTPDGQLLAEGVLDAALSGAGLPALPLEQQLGRWLRAAPAPDVAGVGAAGAGADGAAAAPHAAPPVPPDVVREVLARIGAGRGAGRVWVDVSGSFALGPLRGAAAKAEAEHLGAASREAARRRRLAAIEAELRGAAQARADALAARAEVDRRERVARDEAAGAPSDAPVRRALAAEQAAEAAVADARAALAAEEERALARRQREAQALAERDRAAADLRLSAWVGALDRHDAALEALVRAAAALWPTARAAEAALRRARRAEEEARLAGERVVDRAEARRRAAARLREAEVHRDTLERTTGALVDEILRQLAAARERREAREAEHRAAQRAHGDARVSEARAQGRIEPLRERIERAARERAAHIEALAVMARARLLAALDLADVEPGAEGAAGWSPTRAVEVARRIEASSGDVEHDDRAWERLQRGIFRHVEALRDALLPHGYGPQTTSEDGLIAVTVPFQDRTWAVHELRAMLADEVAHRRTVLDAREREVLENHLIGEVASHLHDLLHRCEAMVRDMNQELAARPTSTGMRLRFSWAPLADGPPGLLEARQRLLRAGGTWSPADRALLARFLKDRIEGERARGEAASWQEQLSAALDYRAWHAFAVERHQDGAWKRLTRRTYGTGSGGEKALALTIPQFAAAAAHYRSAHPHAPRLILLDEAFVGIDPDMRAKCMGLLAAFDLDFVMTSEREWGCYATLPGLAIHQLTVRPGIDAVGVTRWVWNGRERVRAGGAAGPAGAGAPGPAGAGAPGPLFGDGAA